MRIYRSWIKTDTRALDAMLAGRRAGFDAGVIRKTADIVESVRRRGDAALLAATARYDGVRLTARTLRVPEVEFRRAWAGLDREKRAAMRLAWGNILAFHKRQKFRGYVLRRGYGVLRQVVRPLDRVGIHISAAAAPLVSTLLMCAGAARAAGVGRIVLVSPPRYGGSIAPAILAAARLAGITEAYRAGGAQAVAALVCGTATIPAVDKVVGPGNVFTQAAKMLTQGSGGLEGASEIVILADETALPAGVAADVLAQAEHTGDNPVILVTQSRALVLGVLAEVNRQIRGLPRARFAAESLSRYGGIVLVRSLKEGMTFAERFAPEHLAIAARGALGLALRVRRAGTVLVGGASPVAAADYGAGPNHVLPTAGTARFDSGLGVKDFVKSVNITALTDRGLARLGPKLAVLARMEGLEGHARSMEMKRG
jgi:histidinol dehydrogenase